MSVRLSRSSMNDWGIRPAMGVSIRSCRRKRKSLALTGEASRGIQKCQRPAGPGVVVSQRCNSVQALATALFALNLLGVTLHGSGCLALTLGGRLFVEFAAADFSQYTGFFAGALEATQSYVEGFVLFNFDGGHPGRTFQLPGVVNALLQAALEDVFSRVADVTRSGRGMQRLHRKALAGAGGGDYHARLLSLPGWKRCNPMRVLGLETSCDETGVALYDSEQGLLADALFSQIDLHRVYGGVVPELASRDHVKRMLPLIRQVLDEAGCEPSGIDAIAYTAG